MHKFNAGESLYYRKQSVNLLSNIKIRKLRYRGHVTRHNFWKKRYISAHFIGNHVREKDQKMTWMVQRHHRLGGTVLRGDCEKQAREWYEEEQLIVQPTVGARMATDKTTPAVCGNRLTVTEKFYF